MNFGTEGSEASFIRRRILMILVNSPVELLTSEIRNLGWGDCDENTQQQIYLALRWLEDRGLAQKHQPAGYRSNFWKTTEQGKAIFTGEAGFGELPIVIPGGHEDYPVISDVREEPFVTFVAVDEDLLSTDRPVGVFLEMAHSDGLLSPDAADELANRLRQAAARARFEAKGRRALQQTAG